MSLIRDLIRSQGEGKRQEKATTSSMTLEKCLDCIKEYFDCSICRDSLQKPIQTQCGHVFCGKCLKDLCMQPTPTCPLCKKPISHRSLIARDDVGDIMELVGKLNNVFTLEVQRFFNVTDIRPSACRNSLVKATKKVSVDEEVVELVENIDKEESRDEIFVGKTEKDKKYAGSAKVDNQIRNESLGERCASTARNKALKKNLERVVVKYKDADEELIESRKTSTSQKLNQMKNQNYAIITADVIPETPLDLSLACSRSPSNIKYTFKSAVKYVKPLDLSVKKEKRKLDEVDENVNDNDDCYPSSATAVPEQIPLLHQRKKGKFDVVKYDGMKKLRKQIKMSDVVAINLVNLKEDDDCELLINDDPPVFTPTPPEHQVQSANDTKKNIVNKRSQHHNARITQFNSKLTSEMREFTEVGMDASVFTPTPPESTAVEKQIQLVKERMQCTKNTITQRRNNKVPVTNYEQTSEIVEDFGNVDDFVFTPPPKLDKPIPENFEQKSKNHPSIRNQRSIKATQYDKELSSEIMRNFDIPFDENDQNFAIEGKITSSDELFCSINIPVISRSTQSSKYKRQVRSPSPEPVNSRKHQDGDSFIFKPPNKSVSQAPKKKTTDDQRENDNEYRVVEDEFQQPRDSDLLFLNLSGGCTDDGKRLGAPNLDVCVANENCQTTDSDFGPDCEKENGADVQSLSRSGNRKTSPVKVSKPSTSELNNGKNKARKTLAGEGEHDIKKKSQYNKDVDMFEDEEDEDWLLDIPDCSARKSSGKPKQDFQRQKSNVTEEVAAAEPISLTKQRYVFCPTRLNKPQTIKLQTLCKMCDGIITKEFTEDVTHLVINLINGRVPQTLKYLLAIAGRKWVVIYDWVEKCVDSGEIVSEGPYETSNFKQCDPGVKRSRLSKKNLFEGFKFYFATEIYKSLGFTKNEVTTLLSTLGATVVVSSEHRHRDLIIIGSLNGNSTEYNDWLNTNKWVTVTFDWVIECILEYRLKPFEQKHLCVDASNVKSINAPKSFQTAFTQYLTQKSLGMSPLSC